MVHAPYAGAGRQRVSDLDATLAALAEPSRRGVVDLLRAGPQRASKLAEQLQLSPAAMSRHLRVLRQAGLVSEESPPDDARVRLYQLRPEPFEGLSDWVTEVEAFWGEQLLAFKQHVEQRASGAPRTPSSRQASKQRKKPRRSPPKRGRG